VQQVPAEGQELLVRLGVAPLGRARQSRIGGDEVVDDNLPAGAALARQVDDRGEVVAAAEEVERDARLEREDDDEVEARDAAGEGERLDVLPELELRARVGEGGGGRVFLGGRVGGGSGIGRRCVGVAVGRR
jgi:hypothetical protein